ncbi:MAG: Ig-like domain-containing protein [Prolixibacteraceae bacterium]
MKKILFLLVAFLSTGTLFAQKISPYLIGTNAWQPPWHSGSQMNNLWGELKDAGFQMVRIGGNGAQNSSDYTNERIGQLVDSLRAIGVEPLVQVPHTFTASQTTTLITYLNGTLGLGVKFWGVGNEPNLDNDWSDPIPVSQVATYIKTISSALKAYDPSIKVQGPDCAWLDGNYNNPLFVNSGTNNVAGKDANGNYYIDIYAWHKYGIKGASDIEGDVNSAISMIDKINENRPESPMTWAIGEINSHWDNSMVGEDQKVWSFRSGQAFAELYDMAMRKGGFTICPWSIFEGGGNRGNGDLGLFDLVNGELKARSSYYHTLMLGQNMRTNYLTNSDNSANVYVCAMGDSTGSSIMIMNKSTSKTYDYSLSLNGVYAEGKELTIKVEAGIEKVLDGNLDPVSTKMMVFDGEGKLTKRYTYSKVDANNMSAPTMELFTGTSGNSGSLEFSAPVKNGRYEETDTVFVALNVASADGIESVTLYLNSQLLSVDDEAPYEWGTRAADSTLINLPIGEYELMAVAKTNAGDSISSSMNFLVAEPFVLPVVAFTSPENGAVYKAGVNLKVTNVIATHPSEISNVKLYLNGSLVRQENIAPYDWGLDGQNDTKLENLKAGTYELKALATANSGEQNEALIQIVVEQNVKVDEWNEGGYKVFPNPVQSILFVEQLNPISRIELLNCSGSIVNSVFNEERSSCSINMDSYPDGLYFLRITDVQKSMVLKILKQVK